MYSNIYGTVTPFARAFLGYCFCQPYRESTFFLVEGGNAIDDNSSRWYSTCTVQLQYMYSIQMCVRQSTALVRVQYCITVVVDISILYRYYTVHVSISVTCAAHCFPARGRDWCCRDCRIGSIIIVYIHCIFKGF